MRFEFTLTGQTALLMHYDDVPWADAIDAWRLDAANTKKKGEKSGDDRRPAWTWLGYCYHDGKNISMPSFNLTAAFKKAGARVPLGRQKTFKEIAVSGILFDQEHLAFTNNGKPVPVAKLLKLSDEPLFTKHIEVAAAHGIKLDVRRVPIGQSKHVRVRPRFEEWEVSGTLEVIASEIDAAILDAIFTQVGRGGLCDWRPTSPRSPGPFGISKHKLKRVG